MRETENWASGSESSSLDLGLANCHAEQLQRWYSWDFGRVDPVGSHAHFGSGQQLVGRRRPAAFAYVNKFASGFEAEHAEHLPAEGSLGTLGR